MKFASTFPCEGAALKANLQQKAANWPSNMLPHRGMLR